MDLMQSLKEKSKDIHALTLSQPLSTPQLKKRVIVISGPTATGKTDLSLSIAQDLGGEIISADSCQVYKNMDIGTAKATWEQRSLITHHLIDICDISEHFNVAEFTKSAHEALKEILSRDKVPIVVGGSGFYIRSLLYGAPLGPPSNKELRHKLEQQIQDLGPEFLFERLQMLDPEYAQTISAQDKHKIVRAFEIMTLSGKKVSDFPKPEHMGPKGYDFRCWFLFHPRELLYDRIEARCDEMIANGLIEEVKQLILLGIKENPSASQAIGYRQALEFLDSPQTPKDFERFVLELKKATRNFAKRQFTWFKKEPLFRWLDVHQSSKERLKELIIQDFEQGYPCF